MARSSARMASTAGASGPLGASERRRDGIHVTYIGNFLSKHGLNPTYAEALVPQLSALGIPVAWASQHLNPVVRMVDMVAAALRTPRNGSCVVIDLYSGPRAFQAAGLVARACRITRRPYVIVLHGGNLPRRLETSRSQLLTMLNGAARVVSPSPYLAGQFAPHTQVEVIPNALPIRSYPFTPRGKVSPRLLYLRAFHQYYDPVTALRAFSLVRRHYPAARFTMAGPDEDGTLSRCRALVDELGLGGSVDFPGRLPKAAVPSLGEQHDIFVNSSAVDNTPLSTVEAMAMGMCVVATTAGGLPYLLQDGETALLVPPSDPTAMADAIMRILRDPGMARYLSTGARAVAEEMDWSCVVPRWLDLIREVGTNGR